MAHLVDVYSIFGEIGAHGILHSNRGKAVGARPFGAPAGPSISLLVVSSLALIGFALIGLFEVEPHPQRSALVAHQPEPYMVRPRIRFAFPAAACNVARAILIGAKK